MVAVRRRRRKRILIVTPEITYLPKDMGNMANYLSAKAGGLADVSAGLTSALYELGADVHVTLPHYRQMFSVNIGQFINEELRIYKSKLPEDRIHLAEDRIFYYRNHVYEGDAKVNARLALTFQREVINNIIPRVNPDIVHCNDWMTGLIPAAARRQNIKSLFTLHNIHSVKVSLDQIEDVGIDVREFWESLYFERPPHSFEESMYDNAVDLLVSGIFGSHFINTVSPHFLEEIVNGQHGFVADNVLSEVRAKFHVGQAGGVLNSPDPKFHPRVDPVLHQNFDRENAIEGKQANKVNLQQFLGLEVDEDAAMFFWPSRLDPVQKGCQLLTDILYSIVTDYWDQDLQVVVVANGPYQQHFHQIVQMHHFWNRISVCDFDDALSRRAYASSDYLFMPSLFEPCGLPQMIGPIYGTLPIARDTGGIHDTVRHINAKAGTGNGFLFDNYDATGLRWAIDQAMAFHRMDPQIRQREIKRVMGESEQEFNHDKTARRYIDIYNKITV